MATWSDTVATAKYPNYGPGDAPLLTTESHTFHMPHVIVYCCSCSCCLLPAPAPSPHSWCSTCLIFGAEQTLSGTESAQPQAIPCLTFEAASFFVALFILIFIRLLARRGSWMGGGQVRYSGCCHVLFIVFCLTKHPLVATETGRSRRYSLHPFVLGMFYCCCVINLMAGKCEQPEAGDGPQQKCVVYWQRPLNLC